jgi:RimJ/RimL family protein N-acetyltransferase
MPAMRRVNPRLEPVIETRRLRLRPLREADLDDIVAGIGDLAVSRMLARVPYPYARIDAENFLSKATRNALAGTSFFLIIEREGSFAGALGIGAMPYVSELGYWLARGHWGHGLMTEAADAVLAYGFDRLDLKLVRSGVFVDNPGSLRVQEKLGFQSVGRSMRRSLARGTAVEHIDTVLTRARFRRAA